ncbi:hypothetical protein XENOCAPTIV_009816 [Xenoophorus captivus]|uniref:Uncharacterized protein n=1 Tax=Xenoophorus captivus TaxID=1517983 RepID=A0ABV0RDC7_9TELE
MELHNGELQEGLTHSISASRLFLRLVCLQTADAGSNCAGAAFSSRWKTICRATFYKIVTTNVQCERLCYLRPAMVYFTVLPVLRLPLIDQEKGKMTFTSA